MATKKLMKGAEVLGASAIMAGCKHFFGYPITPQNEVPEFMARELPKIDGVYVQAESEVSAINMLYGGAATGKRVMTSSSSPGIALKQEGISYMAGAELPGVIVSASRGGPGLGGILPSQADYFQATRGGGNGDYRVPVYAPNNLQEASDLVQKSFYIGEKYRTPVMVLVDGMLVQMMEAVEIKEAAYPKLENEWGLTGKKNHGGTKNVVTSLNLSAQGLEDHNLKLQAKYDEITKNEVMYETYNLEGASIVVVAYGSASRIVRNAINEMKAEGINIGLIRPITLWPFPTAAFDEIDSTTTKLLSAELSMGQMIDDVKIAVNGRWDVDFYGRAGGIIFTPDEIKNKINDMLKEGN